MDHQEGQAQLATPEGRLQEALYEYPYHHIPSVSGGGASRSVSLRWGLEYLCYMYHIRDMVLSLEPESVLDIGSGDGRFLGMLPGLQRRVGVDVSSRAIQFARAFHPEVEFLEDDGSSLDQTFDVVTVLEVLEHIPDHDLTSFLQLICRQTYTGGHVIVSVPTTVQPLARKHYRHYTLSLLEHELAEASVPLEIRQADHVFQSNLLYELYQRATMNRLWTVEIPALNKAMWRYVWNKLRWATLEHGRHLVVVLQKTKDRDADP
jgi:2-polyprenyl-3-methyl-5-hydroxy-6-metoxy-1,4-benzoquinol methylase